MFKRQIYKGYVIDHDDLCRSYVYNNSSLYSEESVRDYNCGRTLADAKAYIDWLVSREVQ